MAIDNKKIISIIIPVYNVEKYISECLNSILNQTTKNFELIIVDDGSTDNSYSICDSFRSQHENIKLFHKKNGGVSSARNFALDHVSGDYIYFIDPDDYLNKNAFEIMLSNMGNNDLLTFNWKQVYKNHEIVCGVKESFVIDLKDAIQLCIKTENSFSGYLWNKLFVSKIIKENGLKFDSSISICEDQLFVIEYLRKCNRIKSITDVLYNYRMRSSAASKKFNIVKYSSMLKSYETIIDTLKQLNLKGKEFIEYEYLFNYYLYKKIFDANKINISEEILFDYKNVLKSKLLSFKKRKDLFWVKNCNILFRIRNRFFSILGKKNIMYE